MAADIVLEHQCFSRDIMKASKELQTKFEKKKQHFLIQVGLHSRESRSKIFQHSIPNIYLISKCRKCGVYVTNSTTSPIYLIGTSARFFAYFCCQMLGTSIHCKASLRYYFIALSRPRIGDSLEQINTIHISGLQSGTLFEVC